MGSFHLNSTVSIIAAVIGCTVLGVVIEKIAYKPLRKASPLAVLITAIGVSYFLQNFCIILFGADTKSFTSVVSIPTIKLAGGDLTISGVTIATVISCIIIMAALMIFIKKSKSGQAMLAVSEDKDAAQLMGVNVKQDNFPYICYRFRISSYCRCVIMFRLPNPVSLHGCDAWY